MFFISCDFDEGEASTYRAIELSLLHGGESKDRERFATGDPLHDYLTAMYVVFIRYERAGLDPDDATIMGSSSVDHFAMDGGITLDAEGADMENLKRAARAAKEYEDTRGKS